MMFYCGQLNWQKRYCTMAMMMYRCVCVLCVYVYCNMLCFQNSFYNRLQTSCSRDDRSAISIIFKKLECAQTRLKADMLLSAGNTKQSSGILASQYPSNQHCMCY